MSRMSESSAKVELTLHGPARFQAVSQEAQVVVTVLRARVTAERSWYRVEVRGSRSGIARAIDRLRDGCP